MDGRSERPIHKERLHENINLWNALLFDEKTVIEVFKTNVQKKAQSNKLQGSLLEEFPSLRINFDLSDCDKVLRVEGDDFEAIRIKSILQHNGFTCEVLDT